MSGFSTSLSEAAPLPSFLIFSALGSTRQSATAAAITAMSAGSAASTASCISRAVVTGDDAHTGGRRQFDRTADQRHLRAGRASAAAIAWPCRPEERLAR